MQTCMSQKLGLGAWQAGDETLIDDLWSLMQASHADFTLTFRQLAYAPGLTQASQAQIECDLGGTVNANVLPFVDLFIDRSAAQAWLNRYRTRLGSEAAAQDWQRRVKGMLGVNPLYVLRNHIAQQAIEAAEKGDFSELERQFKFLRHPFEAQPGLEAYAAAPPAGALHLEVSCSS
jgi:uncharacterized protein YdiU (UPF0061 family)